jgi:hypothetical protein
MPILNTRPLLAVLVKDKEMATKIPNQTNIRKFTDPSDKQLANYNNIFVSVSLHDLPTVSTFVKEANDKNHLRSLLVRDVDASNLLPQFLYRANLRTLRSLIVHSDTNVLPRILNAYSIEAEQDLIADARIINQQLMVLNCAGNTYDVSFEDLNATLCISRLKQCGTSHHCETKFSPAPCGAGENLISSDIAVKDQDR